MSVFAWLIQGPILVLEPLISISYCISSTENIIWYLLGNCLWLSTSLKLKWFCCRSLVHRLEKVDPSRMKNDEKLAFWINIHNALVMHVMNGFHCKILKKKKKTDIGNSKLLSHLFVYLERILTCFSLCCFCRHI